MPADPVLTIQTSLSRLGFTPGRLDGLFGVRTRTAMEAAGVGSTSLDEAVTALTERVAVEVDTIPMLTAAQVQALAPHFPASWAGPLNAALIAGHITPDRLPMFLAQIAHESAGFATLTEYASGSAYEGRADLGNTQSGDGRRYKGRGVIQLTGRANYRRYGKLLGIDLEAHPSEAATAGPGFLIAAWYWLDHGLNHLADDDDFEAITRKINGGLTHQTEREAWLEKAQALFPQGVGVETPAPEAPLELIDTPTLVPDTETTPPETARPPQTPTPILDRAPAPDPTPPLSSPPPIATSPSDHLEDLMPDPSTAIAQPDTRDRPLKDWLKEHFSKKKEQRDKRRALLRKAFESVRGTLTGAYIVMLEEIEAEGGDPEEALEHAVSIFLDVAVDAMVDTVDANAEYKPIKHPELREWLKEHDGPFIRRMFKAVRTAFELNRARKQGVRMTGIRLIPHLIPPMRLVAESVVQNSQGTVIEGAAIEATPARPATNTGSAAARRMRRVKEGDHHATGRGDFSAADLPTRSGVEQ